MSEELVKVAETTDVPVGSMKMVKVGAEEVLLTNVQGRYYAIGNVCTHVGGPLSEGVLEGNLVECPWHGSKFDVTTGAVTRPPARRPEPVYEVKVEGTSILIKRRT